MQLRRPHKTKTTTKYHLITFTQLSIVLLKIGREQFIISLHTGRHGDNGHSEASNLKIDEHKLRNVNSLRNQNRE